jgi:hypothetical protein
MVGDEKFRNRLQNLNVSEDGEITY